MSDLDEVKHNIYPDASSPQMPSSQPAYQRKHIPNLNNINLHFFPAQTANLGHPSQNPQHPQPNQYDQSQLPPRVVYVANTHSFGPKPAVMECPHCHQNIQVLLSHHGFEKSF